MKKIIRFIRTEGNDAMLGRKIRNYYWENKERFDNLEKYLINDSDSEDQTDNNNNNTEPSEEIRNDT